LEVKHLKRAKHSSQFNEQSSKRVSPLSLSINNVFLVLIYYTLKVVLNVNLPSISLRW
jgi:hypothetical protein